MGNKNDNLNQTDNSALHKTDVNGIYKVCQECLNCWNYLNDETSNCKGSIKICHEFNDYDPYTNK